MMYFNAFLIDEFIEYMCETGLKTVVALMDKFIKRKYLATKYRNIHRHVSKHI